MKSPSPPSRVAARLDLPPIKIVTPRAGAYKPLGGKFPFEVSECQGAVRVNIDYVRNELVRWRQSMAILSDEALLYDKVQRFGSMAHFQMALTGLHESVTDDNRVEVGRAIQAVLPPLAPWTGAIIRDGVEYDDIFRCVGESLLDLLRNVIALDATTGLTDQQVKTLCRQVGLLESRLRLHDGRAKTDGFMAANRDPFGYLWHSLLRHPFTFTKRLAALSVRPLTGPIKRWRIKRAQPKGVPEHLLPDVL